MAAPAQPNMDEILSSIRSTLEEETAKGGTSGQGVAGTEEGVLMLEQELSDDEILALTEQELAGAGTATPTAAGTEEGLIDLAAFTASGSVTNAQAPAPVSDDVLGAKMPAEPMPVAAAEPATAVPAQPEAEELDRLMDQIKQDQATPHAEKVAAILGDEPLPAAAVAAPEVQGASLPGPRLELPALNGAGGLQVALPSVVLAEALRPLITSWLNENLPGVVERLVQVEIAKLANQ